jgi:DNA primase
LQKAVNDSIFNLRRVLIAKKINELLVEVKEGEKQIDLEEIKNYTDLKKRLFSKLNRVI